MADLVAGTAVPHAVKLKELTSEWRRMSVGGEAVLGMGGMMQMMQSVGSMFGGGGASDTFFTRGATITIGDQQFLIGYRLPVQGIDFGALMAMGAPGRGAPGAPPKLPQRPAITPETELSLVLINLRAIASISDIRPFDMAEVMKPATPGPLEGIFEKSKEKAQATSATSNMRQLALGVLMYCQDYDEALPPMRDAAALKKTVLPYVKSEGVFRSPATGQPFQPNPRLAGRRLRQLGQPSNVVMLYSLVPEPDGHRLVARLDGAVRAVTTEEWKKLARTQRLPDQ
jgi:hypothetical protein